MEDDAIPEDDTPAAIKKYESDLEKAIKLCKRKNVGRTNLENVSSEFVLIDQVQRPWEGKRRGCTVLTDKDLSLRARSGPQPKSNFVSGI